MIRSLARPRPPARALLVLCLLLLRPAFGAPPREAELLRRLESSSREVETLSGRFTQRNRLSLFKQELKSEGRFFFHRPRRIRWEYTVPDPSTMILDGDKATLRTPGTAPQVFDLRRDATMRTIFDQLLLWLVPGSLDRARADYALSVGGSAERPSLSLQPKEGSLVARAFRKIRIELDGKTLLLREIVLTEKNGDEKTITFSKLERNVKLPPDAFR